MALRRPAQEQFEMKEEELLKIKSYTRALPSLPYGRYVSQAGTAGSTTAFQNSSSLYLHSRVKVLAIFASTRRPCQIEPSGEEETSLWCGRKCSSDVGRAPMRLFNSQENCDNRDKIPEETALRTESVTNPVVVGSLSSLRDSDSRSNIGHPGSSLDPDSAQTTLSTASFAEINSLRQKRIRDWEDDNGDCIHAAKKIQKGDKTTTFSSDEQKPERHIYFRLQYDKSCIETLPLELMRERHPQVLIDYLLSSSMWS